MLYHAQSVSHRHIYCRVAWRGSRRVQIAFNDLGIDFPLQLILKQARAVKSRIGHERTQLDSTAAGIVPANIESKRG